MAQTRDNEDSTDLLSSMVQGEVLHYVVNKTLGAPPYLLPALKLLGASDKSNSALAYALLKDLTENAGEEALQKLLLEPQHPTEADPSSLRLTCERDLEEATLRQLSSRSAEELLAVTSLTLADWPQLTDRGLLQLRGLRLETFRLQECPRVSRFLPDLDFSALTSLTLSDCASFRDQGVGALGALAPGLASLALLECPRITDDGLLQFTEAVAARLASPHPTASLTSLSISDCPKVNFDLPPRALLILNGLATVKLAECPKVAEAAVASAAQLPSLQGLSLRDCPRLRDEALPPLLPLPELLLLSLVDCPKVTAAGLKRFEPKVQLTVLYDGTATQVGTGAPEEASVVDSEDASQDDEEPENGTDVSQDPTDGASSPPEPPPPPPAPAPAPPPYTSPRPPAHVPHPPYPGGAPSHVGVDRFQAHQFNIARAPEF